LNSEAKFVYLHYTGERGREQFHVTDFELDLTQEDVWTLNTSKLSEEECIKQIYEYVGEKSTR
jgi:hypothetical protein